MNQHGGGGGEHWGGDLPGGPSPTDPKTKQLLRCAGVGAAVVVFPSLLCVSGGRHHGIARAVPGACQKWCVPRPPCTSPPTTPTPGPLPPQRLPVQASVLAFLPAVLLGLAGGLTGMLFTYGNLKATRYRARVLRDTKSLTLLEPCVLALIYCSIAFWLPFVWPCSPLPDVPNAEQVLKSHRFHLVDWICPREGEYSPMATLTYNGPEEVLKSLFAHQLPGLFHRSSLLVYLILYFTFACYRCEGLEAGDSLAVPLQGDSGHPTHPDYCLHLHPNQTCRTQT